jgi:hypothetical protein
MSVFISILACDDRYRIDGIVLLPRRDEQKSSTAFIRLIR